MGRPKFSNRRRALVAAAVFALLGLGFAGFAVFLVTQGLDKADQWASVVSAFVGLVGLTLAVVSLRGGRGVSVRTGRVDGQVIGIQGTPTSDRSGSVRTDDVGFTGTVIGWDTTKKPEDTKKPEKE